MHEISERRDSGLGAADGDMHKSEASINVGPVGSETAAGAVEWRVGTDSGIGRITSGPQTRTPMSHCQVGGGSLCLHHLHLQRNFQVQAGSHKKER